MKDYKIIKGKSSVIFKDNMDMPVHRWFHYTEGFSNEFVNECFDKYGIGESATVFEPFMGSGTVGVCAKIRSINSIGIELSPLMHFISSIKTNFEKYDLEKFNNMRQNLFFSKHTLLTPPEFLKNEKHFLPEVLDEILKIKEGVWKMEKCNELELFKLAFANTLLDSSNAKRVPSFGYKKKSNVFKGLPYQIFNESLDIIFEDIMSLKNNKLGKVEIVLGDSRNQYFEKEIADIAITSPPYANGIDYVTDYQLEMGWLDLIDTDSKKELRDKMISYDKTRVGLLREFYNSGNFYKEENLMEVVNKLRETSKTYWKPDIHLVILKYFDDMHKTFANTFRILKPKGRFILVVGDSLFNNIYVPADLLLAKLGENIGFELESIELARDRYSGQNRGFKLRETIITLRKK